MEETRDGEEERGRKRQGTEDRMRQGRDWGTAKMEELEIGFPNVKRGSWRQ